MHIKCQTKILQLLADFSETHWQCFAQGQPRDSCTPNPYSIQPLSLKPRSIHDTEDYCTIRLLFHILGHLPKTITLSHSQVTERPIRTCRQS